MGTASSRTTQDEVATRDPETVNQLDLAVASSRAALKQLAKGGVNRSAALAELAHNLHLRFRNSKSLKDLDESISLDRAALQLRPHGHPERHNTLASLAISTWDRFNLKKDAEDMEESIRMDRAGLDLRPSGHPGRLVSLANLAIGYQTRYRRTGRLEDLDELITLHRETLNLHPIGHPDRHVSLSNLELSTWQRWQKTGRQEDMDESIKVSREALCLRPIGHPDRLSSLQNLSIGLRARYDRTRGLQDLSELVGLRRSALELHTTGDPRRDGALGNLAAALQAMYDHTGSPHILDECIATERAALESRPQGHPERHRSLGNLAITTWSRYIATGSEQDMEESIEMERAGLELRPEGHPLRCLSMSNLAIGMSALYERNGDLFHLEEAIHLQRAVLKARPPDHPQRHSDLASLAVYTWSRYLRASKEEDMEESIDLDRATLELRPPGHPMRTASLNNLAIGTRARFGKKGNVADLEETLRLDRAAMELCPETHPNHHDVLNYLTSDLIMRFNKRGDVQAMEEAIDLRRSALALRPVGHTMRHLSLNQLAHGLLIRYRLSKRVEDWDEQASLLEDAYAMCPSGDPNLAIHLFNTCDAHMEHGTKQYQPERAISRLAQALAQTSLNARFRLARGHQVLTRLSEMGLVTDHAGALVDVFHTTIRLFPEVLLLSNTLQEQLAELRNADGLAATAAHYAISVHKVGLAVELLEAGRGTVWAQALRLRTQLDTVPPHYREELLLLSRQLERELFRQNKMTSDPRRPNEAEESERKERQERFDALVVKIRAEPGLERFLLPDDFAHLTQHADRGPIVMLIANKFSCTAVLLRKPGVAESIRLSTTAEELRTSARQLEHATSSLRRHLRRRDQGRDPDVLEKEVASASQSIAVLGTLWTHVVLPILQALDLQRCDDLRQRPRLWWCLSGDFSWLPLHAAGTYANALDSECCSDYVVSSYAPTLSALSRARREYRAVHKYDSQLLLAAVPHPHPKLKLDPLPGVRSEIETIVRIVPPSVLFPVPPDDDPLRTENAGARATTITRGLKFASLVHLACHGMQHPTNALESGFAMRDALLTIERLIRRRSPKAFFAFLSACETARGDDKQPDQVIHLAAAMLFAGFKSIIGTMWSMGDEDGIRIASTVYRRLYEGQTDYFDPDVIPRALDEAVRELRTAHPHPGRWALYVHLGL